VLGDRRESPPGFASDHLGVRAFLHEVRGEEGEADHVLQLLSWLDKVEERPSARTAWTAQLYARRRMFDMARAHLEKLSALVAERHSVLQTWCELIAEEEAWDRAKEVARDARAHADASGAATLTLFADRLEGRAALSGGDTAQALGLLGRAASGFRDREAIWEAAVTEVELAEALIGSGRPDEAEQTLEHAVPVLERLGSVRELSTARALRDRLS
jgi:hypothetical protein